MEVLHIIITNCISVEHTVHLMKHFQRNLYCLYDKPDIHNKTKDDQVMFYTILYTFTTCVSKDQVFMLEYIMQIAYEKVSQSTRKAKRVSGRLKVCFSVLLRSSQVYHICSPSVPIVLIHTGGPADSDLCT